MNIYKELCRELGGENRNGIYHYTQIKLAYNSNKIEGSRLTEEQTSLMFETKSIIQSKSDEAIMIDDIIEMQNHFSLFNYMLKTLSDPLSEELIKQYHKILKTGTVDEGRSWFAVGEYKNLSNYIGTIKTAEPGEVKDKMETLIRKYNDITQIKIEDIIDFHYNFEIIHPFQDGNGRVGRMIMFRECLRNNIVPFIIEDVKKAFYYRGLSEYKTEPGYLVDTCLSAQDNYKKLAEIYTRQIDEETEI